MEGKNKRLYTCRGEAALLVWCIQGRRLCRGRYGDVLSIDIPAGGEAALLVWCIQGRRLCRGRYGDVLSIDIPAGGERLF
jgi:hypothetical protein